MTPVCFASERLTKVKRRVGSRFFFIFLLHRTSGGENNIMHGFSSSCINQIAGNLPKVSFADYPKDKLDARNDTHTCNDHNAGHLHLHNQYKEGDRHHIIYKQSITERAGQFLVVVCGQHCLLHSIHKFFRKTK